MKYTKSKDGVKRVTVRAEVRLTKNEFRTYNRMVVDLGYKSLSDFLGFYLSCADLWMEEITAMNDDIDNDLEAGMQAWLRGK